MIYCMSDIHGEFDLFIKMLQKINFSKEDTLYILGDMIDKGPSSVKLLKYIFLNNNIKCILGNHEYDFLKRYNALMETVDNPSDYDFVLKTLQDYFPNDGHLLTFEMIDKLEALPCYIETDEYILVHSGVSISYGFMKPLKETSTEEFVYNRTFKDYTKPVTSKCIIYGHTPVRYISGCDEIISYPRNNNENKQLKDYYKIHIDTGVYLSGVLGLICLDDCSVYYVRK